MKWTTALCHKASHIAQFVSKVISLAKIKILREFYVTYLVSNFNLHSWKSMQIIIKGIDPHKQVVSCVVH